MLKQSIGFNSVVLAAFALVTAILLASTHLGTREQIAESERRAAEKALLEIIPEDRHSNNMLVDTIAIPRQFWGKLGLAKGGNINVARNNGRLEALIIPAIAPDGYSGDIRLIIGVNMNGSLAGVRVLAHAETPGLGDKIDLNKSDWILNFNGKSLTKPLPTQWRVKKDGGNFDQFTGATITPRAVVAQVKRTLEYFAEDKNRILKLNQTISKTDSKQSQEPTTREAQTKIEAATEPDIRSDMESNKATEVPRYE